MRGRTSLRLDGRDDDIARQAKRAMAKWKMTLDERTRAELREPTRRERVQMEIETERSRRTVRKTVATGSNSALPRGSLIVRPRSERQEREGRPVSRRSQVAANSTGETGCGRPRRGPKRRSAPRSTD
jgi:hypothetical protein